MALATAPQNFSGFALYNSPRTDLNDVFYLPSAEEEIVQRDVNEWREANVIPRSGNAPRNAERSKGRFGEAEPEVMSRPKVASQSEVARGLRASVCARAPLIGV